LDNKECVIIDITKNTISVFVPKKKPEGANSFNYYDMKSFNKRFKKI
jgi:hypothetical protein